MQLLLDTHALLWYLQKSTELPWHIAEAIENRSNAVFVSIVTLWEISIKISIGKLTLQSTLDELEHDLTLFDIALLPLTVSDVVRYTSLTLHHRDPFDRMLIVQALERNLAFVSKEELFERYGVQRFW